MNNDEMRQYFMPEGYPRPIESTPAGARCAEAACSGSSTADEAYLIVQRADREMRKIRKREASNPTDEQVHAFAVRWDMTDMSTGDLRSLISDASSLHLSSPNK